MGNLIGFGKGSKYYLYILATVIIKAVKDVVFGFSDIDQRNKEDFQVFPKEFSFKGVSIENAYKQIGNTVCVPIVKRISDNI